MTESEWMASDDPAKMLQLLAGNDMAACRWRQSMPGNGINRLSDRKARLFAAACCRQVWHLLTDPRSRNAVEVAERFADGEATRDESQKAFFAADKVYIDLVDSGEPGYSTPRLLALSARDTNQAHAKAATDQIILRGDKVGLARPQIAHLLREIVGNPFRAAKVDPAWLTTQVVSLAHAAYDLRQPDGTLDPECLAVLSDALEEAGCDDEAILRHLRGEIQVYAWREWKTGAEYKLAQWRSLTGPHVRGCWALDLILGKE